MRKLIMIILDCIDGTQMHYTAASPEDAARWISKHDHEGSSLTMGISEQYDDSEAYEWLKTHDTL